MRTINDGYYQFGICDFCEVDSSGNRGKVRPLGEKGICDRCLRQLAYLLEDFRPIKAGNEVTRPEGV